MKIIITGATGFVGRNLAEALRQDGIHIIALGRSEKVGRSLREGGLKFFSADIRNQRELLRAFSAADCVIHCAGKSGPWGKYKDFHETNVVGTRNVVHAIKEHAISKIIFISTPSIYYTGQDRFDISEDDPLPAKQTSNYARSKLISEKELEGLRREGIDTIIFRPRALIGPYDNSFGPRILRMADKGRIPMINGGQAFVDIACIDNFIDAVRKALIAPDEAWNEVYNISNGSPITVATWFSQILDAFGKNFRPKPISEPLAKMAAGVMESFSYLPFVNKEPPMTRFTVGYMAKSMTMRIEKARNKLGYTPIVSNREGFRRYAEWARTQFGEA
jgi:nucleoside-diphosphate-sugar epimerase